MLVCVAMKRNPALFASLVLAAAALACPEPARAKEAAFIATPVGPEVVIFDPRRDACDGHDVPDTPLRAWRGADGAIHAFALHYENRRMSGASILALRPECAIVYRGSGNPDPAAHDDRAWIAATFTEDGKTIQALVHHEYQANTHPGRCRFAEYIKCWWNSVLAIRSEDGGRSFRRGNPLPVAATPFPQEEGQGRHRGFFNPSNIIEIDGALHAMIGTTGWEAAPGRPAQASGVCLFRADDRGRSDWRAWDGQRFSARFPGPSRKGVPQQPCAALAPFPAPVGSVVRHRPSGRWLAIYQAKVGMPDGRGGSYSASGFYLAASPDLRAWSEPTLVLATKTLYDDPCGGAVLRSYPVLIDEAAQSRNFADTGEEALLVFSELPTSGCAYSDVRRLIARKVRISTYRRE
jgi:hypothetical protein